MSAGIIPIIRKRALKRREISPAWRQAFVLASLVLFVASTVASTGERSGDKPSLSASPLDTPCDLLGCSEPRGNPADQVQYIDGVGFVMPGSGKQARTRVSPAHLSEPF